MTHGGVKSGMKDVRMGDVSSSDTPHSCLLRNSTTMSHTEHPKRLFRGDVHLSTIGFGGIILLGMAQSDADRAVADAVAHGINYFDVAPSYGDGEAEIKLGPALEPWRKDVFLACKTMCCDAVGAQQELERSLRRLRTDHIDLYQFHAVTTHDDVEEIFAPGGAIEAFIVARKAGMVRYLGFSAHSQSAALAMMDRFAFDSVLFPFNLVCYGRADFGSAVMARAKEKGVARLALKMLARGPWPEGVQRTWPNAWYLPIADEATAREALRFTLSEDVTAALPPGDIRLFELARKLALTFKPLGADERAALLASTEGSRPLFGDTHDGPSE
jgi:aryl-alcohol dehydrogenase-like predicted oxidoreductase